MPKPGPRPYECVRKAWHSDRHQPIRGSLIQEIFRIVNEIHGSATKKNKEWQEKLPIVVLRAEEILYSKANSEAEYMDLKTLWDRLRDAIDTIIRRDDSTESESRDLLQPCIEAALHLGCSPKRLSRSQRNSSPRYYLSPLTPESNSGNSHDKNRGNPIPSSPFFSKDHKFISATIKIPNPSSSEANKMFPFSTLKFPPSVGIQTLPMQTARASPNSCSMYPLYYGSQFEPSGHKFGSRRDPDSNAMLVDDNKRFAPRNPQSCNLNASNVASRADCEDVIGCDLSLRLGSFVVPCTSVDNTLPEKNKDGDICKLNDLTPQFNRGLSFFFKENADKNQLESSSRKTSSNGKNMKVASVLEKRKLVEDQQIYWPVKLPFTKFRS
ncbi:uncharacterized protein LOC107784049 [Nicotiana tabacum]|uniref:Uncharacterized protein LOC107784049 n=1 Tax=Nicotiana tabacum TaxID=4097 RepID=A0A1S3Z8B3_TOBAC|nr:uncharacterized protein LOC104113357 [Nicotiana tomentosiformis]XP_016460594.1 PREDICTED: uncharacterized protein LOC107784049 [Nicotiana tabacum]